MPKGLVNCCPLYDEEHDIHDIRRTAEEEHGELFQPLGTDEHDIRSCDCRDAGLGCHGI